MDVTQARSWVRALLLLAGFWLGSTGIARADTAWSGVPEPLPTRHEKAVFNPQALTGLWYSPSQDGHGFALTFTGDGVVAATWYVYQNTKQIWLVGSGNLVDNQAVLPAIITSGASFPPDFNTQAVTRTSWGTLTLTVQACDRITVSWSSTLPGFGSGSVDVVPLVVAGGLRCAVSTQDDRADTCSAATAVAPNGQYPARIDSPTDSDFYRLDITTFGVLTASSLSSFDLVGDVLDSTCTGIAANDDAVTPIPGDANSNDFSVSTPVSPGTYYVRVRTYGGVGTGPYTLNLALDTNVAPDDFGNSCDQASALAVPGRVSGRVDPAIDADFFRVVLAQRGALLASTGGAGGLDTIASIRGADCLVIAENDNFESADAIVSAVLDPGTYYVSVRSSGAQTSGAYTLDVRILDPNGDDHGDFCTVGTPAAFGAQLAGRIDSTTDVDFFAYDATTPGTLVVSTSNSSGIDPTVTVFNRNCVPLGSDTDTGPGNEALQTIGLDNGKVFVRVRDAGGGGAGTYQLTTRFFASGNGGPDDFGDSCATAGSIGPVGTANALIEPATDQDFMRLDIDRAGTLRLQSLNLNSSDTAGALLDASCQVITEGLSATAGGAGFDVSRVVQPGTYYLRVRSASGAVSGRYLLFNSFTPATTSKHPVAPTAAPAEFRSKLATPSPAPRATPHAKAVANPSSLSGLWYDRAQDGQGVHLTFSPQGLVALSWYVYSNTSQVYVVGAQQMSGNKVTIPVVITSGAQFLPAFDTMAVTRVPWGTVTLDVRSCSSIVMSWNPVLPGYTAGSMNLTPLLLTGGLTCAVSPDADDHGDTCAAADAASFSAGTAGRIDPPADQDVFRLSVGSSGTLTVQSSGSSTLNPIGALLDSACNVIATSDDAAGREFSIARAVTAGTYYVRVASSGAASVGDYVLGAAFTPASGATTSAVTLNLRDDLLYDLDFRINGGAPVRVAAGTSVPQTLTVSGALNVSFDLVGAVNATGQPVGDLLGGTFDPVPSPAGTLTFAVDNEIGPQRYFAPVITNKTTSPFLVGVNMGTANESRCNCTVAGATQNARVGYYLFLPNSNARAYATGSNYTGVYSFWGDDTGGSGRPLFNVPLLNLLESPTGRVGLKYVALP